MADRDETLQNRIKVGTKAGLTIEKIAEKMISDSKLPLSSYSMILASLEEQIQFHQEFYPNYHQAQAVLKQKFIMDIQTDRYFVYDEAIKHITEVKKPALQVMFNSKAFQEIQDSRLFSACLGYNPNSPELFYEQYNTRHVNLYRPAAWQFPYVYDGKPVPTTPLPERYEKFFKHLCDNEDVSYTYLIHFLAATVQTKKKPQTYLTLLGKQGVGKNTLIEIMKLVLDERNVAEFNQGSLKDVKFNASFKNKKLILFDEVQVRDHLDERFLKQFVNDVIEIEEKGKDAKTYANYASIVLAANSLSAIRVSADDRRYSFLDLPDVSLKQFHSANYKGMSFDDYRKKYLMDKEALVNLGLFLLGFKVDPEITNQPLQSKTRLRQKQESLNDWELAVYDQLAPKHAGKEMTIDAACDALAEIIDTKVRPGREKWRQLSITKPGYFTTYRRLLPDSTRPTFVKFEPLSKQPKEKLESDDV